MKYLYCPKCKELRVKPWYSITDRCSRCRGDVRVINVPRTTESYVIYLLVVLVLALIYVYTNMGREPLFLWTGVGLFIALLVLQFRELSRGEAYARAKIKVTHSDLEKMRKKGWM